MSIAGRSLLLLFCLVTFRSLDDIFFQDPLAANGINNTDWFTVEYYDLTGGTIEELAQSLNEKAPRSLNGRIQFARLSWNLQWNWGKQSGAEFVDLTKSKIHYNVKLLFPRWIPPLNASENTRQFWKQITHAMLRHELNHRNSVPRHVDILRKRLAHRLQESTQLTEKEADELASRTVRELKVENESYDRESSHGLLEGVIALDSTGKFFVTEAGAVVKY